jgi:hypothetical protein
MMQQQLVRPVHAFHGNLQLLRDVVPGSGDPLRFVEVAEVPSVGLGEPYEVDRMLFGDDRASRVHGSDTRRVGATAYG